MFTICALLAYTLPPPLPSLQVWHTPSFEKSMCPMHLHRNYGGCHSDITCIDWSADSQFIAVGSKDLTARRAASCFKIEFDFLLLH